MYSYFHKHFVNLEVGKINNLFHYLNAEGNYYRYGYFNKHFINIQVNIVSKLMVTRPTLYYNQWMQGYFNEYFMSLKVAKINIAWHCLKAEGHY